MAFVGLLEISIAFISYIILHFFLNKKTHECFPRNWPFVGMLPGLLVMLPCFYDYSAEILENSNLTFSFKGPWFFGIDTLATVDPANIHHIMTLNFSNYPKGSEFKKIFDILGDGIFNVDSELWKNLRKSAQTIMSHTEFQIFSATVNRNKLQKGLIPLLDHAAENKMIVDLQDVFQRFTFDTTFTLVTGYDPRCLSTEMPEVEFARALDDSEEAIVYRHVQARILWRLQNWIGIGEEKKMRRAQATVDRLCEECISAKREELRSQSEGEANNWDMLTRYLKMDMSKYKLLNPNDDKFLRDTIFSFMLAGRDTTASALTWFFWLLSKNPQVLTKIRQEINAKLPRTESSHNEGRLEWIDLNKLAYLHSALCETLRLYPPIPFQHKSPKKTDVLPSGHKVKANSKILFCLYAMGRMRSVWGEDAREFKPERWISEGGRLKHEPSFKFLSFNAGPRTCLGKDMAMAQMKMVAIEIIQNYDIKVVETGHKVEPILSLVLHMKHGLKVTITKRNA